MRHSKLALYAFVPGIMLLFGFAALPSFSPDKLAQDAISTDKEISAAAIEELRNMGPKGREVFLETHGQTLDSQPRADVRDIHNALDEISGQRDSYFSGLYWYTDLEKAIEASKKEQKPIISLRMLGNLTDELSCANSRLFRVLLYANSDLSAYMKNNFVMHWSSERPVPVVTIDYGNGQVIKRTLAGNSLHYVLDSTGMPLEAIPGLYSPSEFKRHLAAALELFEVGPNRRFNAVQKFHARTFDQISETAGRSGIYVKHAKVAFAPQILEAERLTVGKSMAETPVLTSIERPKVVGENPWETEIFANTDLNRKWWYMSERMKVESVVDENSQKMMLAKNQRKYTENPELLAQDVKILSNIMMIESSRNEALLHGEIHRWFAGLKGGIDQAFVKNMDRLNEKIYAELFLTPKSDEWLGMLPPDIYTAIENDGVQE